MPEEICEWCCRAHRSDADCPAPRYFEIATCALSFPRGGGGAIVVTLEPGEEELVDLPGGRQALVRRIYLM